MVAPRKQSILAHLISKLQFKAQIYIISLLAVSTLCCAFVSNYISKGICSRRERIQRFGCPLVVSPFPRFIPVMTCLRTTNYDINITNLKLCFVLLKNFNFYTMFSIILYFLGVGFCHGIEGPSIHIAVCFSTWVPSNVSKLTFYKLIYTFLYIAFFSEMNSWRIHLEFNMEML